MGEYHIAKGGEFTDQWVVVPGPPKSGGPLVAGPFASEEEAQKAIQSLEREESEGHPS